MYKVIENYIGDLDSDEIAVGVPYSELGNACPDEFKYNGQVFKRWMADVMPPKYVEEFCSVRIYRLDLQRTRETKIDTLI